MLKFSVLDFCDREVICMTFFIAIADNWSSLFDF